MKLSGMGEAEIQDAATTVLQSTGASSYLHGVGYDLDKFKSELEAAVSYIKSQTKPVKGKPSP